MTVREIFEVRIPERVKDDPSSIESLDAAYLFTVSGEESGDWHADFTTDPPDIGEGPCPNAKCIVTIAGEDLIAIVEGKLNPQMAFMSGKLKLTGDMALALKLNQVLSVQV